MSSNESGCVSIRRPLPASTASLLLGTRRQLFRRVAIGPWAPFGALWASIFIFWTSSRRRLESPDLRRAIIDLHERHSADATLIEDTELGRALAQDLHRTGHLRAIAKRPERDKLARLLAQAARFEAGQIHLPENAPWLATYLNELLGFPNAPHDDQIDATSQALNWLTARTPINRPIVRKDPIHRNVVRKESVRSRRRTRRRTGRFTVSGFSPQGLDAAPPRP